MSGIIQYARGLLLFRVTRRNGIKLKTYLEAALVRKRTRQHTKHFTRTRSR